MSCSHQTVQYMREAKENGLFYSRSTVPALLTSEADARKVYQVRGSSFSVENHYDVVCALGFGAYGIVCAAVDLRLVPQSPYYNERVLEWEEKGLVLSRRRDTDGEQVVYKQKKHFFESSSQGSMHVPSLAGEPYTRRRLQSNAPSPFVAMKKVANILQDLVDGRRVLREIAILRYLRGHPNIIRLHEVMYPAGVSRENFKDIYMVTDLMDTDLAELLKTKLSFDEDQFRYVSYQLIKALLYIHSSGVIHRDIKPGNILLNGDCTMKLCDFGLSRAGIFQCPPGRGEASGLGAHEFDRYRFASASTDEAYQYSLTDYVVTRYYRAPELLTMSRYNHAIDMWSVGCIMAEMLLKAPLFAGTNYLSQLTLILETPGLRGVPTTPEMVDELYHGADEAKWFMKEVLFSRKSEHLRATSSSTEEGSASVLQDVQFRDALFGSATIPSGVSLFLAKLLHLNPQKRPTALEALRDPFFIPIYHPSDEIIRSSDIPIESYLDPIPLEAVETMPGSIDEDLDSFSWEFDHCIMNEEALLNRFRTELDAYVSNSERVRSFSS